VAQGGGRHSSAPIPEIGVSSRNSAVLGIALLVGNITVVMCVLGAKTPATHLPEGALLLDVIGACIIAFEAIGELGFASSTPLP